MTDLVAALRAAGCVWAEDEAALLRGSASDDDQLWALARRRIAGEPLEQVVGWAQFCGLRIAVAPGVFVPRRRSEALARAAVAAARTQPRPIVVDLCCGSGAIAVVVASNVPAADVHAADVDPAAVRCAAGNLAPHGAAVHYGDLFGALPEGLRGHVDVLVANAPYVPTGAIATLPADAREHEPLVALDGGPDGLDLHRRIAAGAPVWLARGGVLLVEVAEAQAAALLEVLRDVGLAATSTRSDEVVVVHAVSSI